MTPRILIVDDEPINLATMEGFLSADGYELHFANNGREAVEKTHALHPDLILLDVMMPEMDGYTVCRLIREDPVIGRIPILIVTALHDQPSRLQGLRCGADDFLTKPCSRDEVRARVRTIASLNRFRSIAEQKTRFEALFELSPAAIVLTDAQGTVLAANRQAETSFAAPRAMLLGCPISAHFDSDAALSAAIATALRPGNPPPATCHALRDMSSIPDRRTQESVPRGDDGARDNKALVQQESATRWEARRTQGGAEQIYYLRASAVPDDRRTLALLVFDDVTAEVNARQALQALNDNLENLVRARTRQLEDANTLLLSYANFVSHDLRSPLTVMKGYLDLLREGVVEIPPDAHRMVGEAHRAACRMSEMIHNILQLAHEIHDRDANPQPPLDARRVITHLVSHLKDLAPNPRTVFTVRPLPEVGVSAALLERVFFNLLTNAAKFSAEQDPPTIEVGSIPHDEGTVLFVRDNGVGFDARETDKLFREFSRLETAGKIDGLGLGLSLVTRLVHAIGGRIWAESEVGHGATFYVLLPRPALPVAADAELIADGVHA